MLRPIMVQGRRGASKALDIPAKLCDHSSLSDLMRRTYNLGCRVGTAV
jgi:hypothetical protein